MKELSFRGKARLRPSWPQLTVPLGVLALQMVLAAYRLGTTGFCWMLAGTVVLVGPVAVLSYRSWSTVGTAGVTVCWGFGRGRTYSWQEIRWVDVRETKSQYGSIHSVRIFTTGGRRRQLPGLQRSSLHPAPDFDADVQRVVNWWELSTDPATRIPPQKEWRDRLTPTVLGILVGFLVIAVVAVFIFTHH